MLLKMGHPTDIDAMQDTSDRQPYYANKLKEALPLEDIDLPDNWMKKKPKPKTANE